MKKGFLLILLFVTFPLAYPLEVPFLYGTHLASKFDMKEIMKL
jgi:hypothetical protein